MTSAWPLCSLAALCRCHEPFRGLEKWYSAIQSWLPTNSTVLDETISRVKTSFKAALRGIFGTIATYRSDSKLNKKYISPSHQPFIN